MASTRNRRTVMKRNGKLIMKAMIAMNEPVTMNELTNYIIESEKIRDIIKAAIKFTLRKGLRYGFITKIGNKYTVSDLQQIAS